MKKVCIICKKKLHRIIWYDHIRVSNKDFSKKKERIVKCLNCDLISLYKKRKHLEDSSVARNLYNLNNKFKTFNNFHYPREIKKIKFIEKFIDLENKKILESNCGTGILLNYLKKKKNLTVGLDSEHYKKYIEGNGHNFFKNLNQIIKSPFRFDIIFSLSELEHKYDPRKFLLSLKKILKNKNSILVIRVPNFYNIYYHLIYKRFLKYDFRESHNYYFSEKNLDLLFKKLGFKIFMKKGFNEYSFNHLLNYLKLQKPIKNKKVFEFINNNMDKDAIQNLEHTFLSTSLIYILKKNGS